MAKHRSKTQRGRRGRYTLNVHLHARITSFKCKKLNQSGRTVWPVSKKILFKLSHICGVDTMFNAPASVWNMIVECQHTVCFMGRSCRPRCIPHQIKLSWCFIIYITYYRTESYGVDSLCGFSHKISPKIATLSVMQVSLIIRWISIHKSL